ncbi:MAG TPA: hypothetical protein VK831_01495 [Candidatus Deferrimicrobiaceae bacterium]|nr:hypothetical protein [Candidatus Deferrimicrobiaceae bacterium]
MLRGLLHRTDAGAAERSIFEHLEAADADTLRGTTQLVAFGILYEHEPRGRIGESVPWPPLHVIVNGALQGMKGRGWAPAILMAHPSTPGAKRQLRQGVEIADGAGLTHTGHNALLARMLAPIVDVNPRVDWRAMAGSGDSLALGANVVAIVAI